MVAAGGIIAAGYYSYEFVSDSVGLGGSIGNAYRTWQQVDHDLSQTAVTPPGVPGGSLGAAGASASATSHDPNAMVGPAGVGSANFAADTSTALPYQIDFENASTATAPAQAVMITDQLDPNLNWSTFQLTGIAWGDTILSIPVGRQFFETTVPMTYNGQTFDVQVEVGLHSSTGQVYATFQSIDPNTELPPNILTGFLPPEDGTGRGMAYISYVIEPKAGLPTGTQIRNVAYISFDGSTSIATDQVSETDPSQGSDPTKEALVTIDSAPPVSTMTALPTVETTTSFPVQWSGQDDAGGSGIASYNVFVAEDGGSFAPLVSATTSTSTTFTGSAGHTYGFYVEATDNVGNAEVEPAVAETSTTISSGPPSTVYVSNTNFGLSSPPTAGQAIADADQGTTGSQAAIFGTTAFADIADALTAVGGSGTIVVNGGTYAESPNITGSETLLLTGNVTVNTIDSTSGTTVNLQANTLTTGTSTGADTIAGVIQGAGGSLVKVGSDSLTLTGTDTYTGPTTVSAGSLIVNGSLGSSTLSITGQRHPRRHRVRRGRGELRDRPSRFHRLAGHAYVRQPDAGHRLARSRSGGQRIGQPECDRIDRQHFRHDVVAERRHGDQRRKFHDPHRPRHQRRTHRNLRELVEHGIDVYGRLTDLHRQLRWRRRQRCRAYGIDCHEREPGQHGPQRRHRLCQQFACSHPAFDGRERRLLLQSGGRA